MVKTNTKRTNTQNNSFIKRHLWATIILILLLGAAITAIIVALNSKPEPKPSETTDNNTTVEAPDNQTDTNVGDQQNSPQPDDKVTRYEGEDPNQKETLTGSILYTNNQNDVLIIAVAIDQFLNTAGTCTLTLTGEQTGTTYTQTVNSTAEVASSYCEIFEIPTSELQSDHYQINIQLSGNQKTGLITGETQL